MVPMKQRINLWLPAKKEKSVFLLESPGWKMRDDSHSIGGGGVEKWGGREGDTCQEVDAMTPMRRH